LFSSAGDADTKGVGEGSVVVTVEEIVSVVWSPPCCFVNTTTVPVISIIKPIRIIQTGKFFRHFLKLIAPFIILWIPPKVKLTLSGTHKSYTIDVKVPKNMRQNAIIWQIIFGGGIIGYKYKINN
jgi:hypothetical protein